ncbi:Hypothetical protein SRAE_X000256700 [Strongyloides ratti]|uniref:Reverse transcriptase/retrotransposon-derived protein RNase H-like domain-containing protein n=1 Tax=Strongyloides ratti TaxID=34506 RepID=A0A090L000_STRRB|nr:Hypothetical protein SRAE_X000256700 [Strongyloides ratti]CEF60784.1 Hypothetical protein SRAE_X000256700 [Strongyloides ratti]
MINTNDKGIKEIIQSLYVQYHEAFSKNEFDSVNCQICAKKQSYKPMDQINKKCPYYKCLLHMKKEVIELAEKLVECGVLTKDDIIVVTYTNLSDHIEILKNLLEVTINNGLKLSPDKTVLMATETIFLGNHITTDKRKIDISHITKILNKKRPMTPAQIDNVGLHLYQPNFLLEVHCDASSYEIEGMLCQKVPHKNSSNSNASISLPLSFYNKTLPPVIIYKDLI